MTLLGYFDAASQSVPVFDPGLDVICPFCAKPLDRPMKTLSLMAVGDDRSYFYRAHKGCYEALGEPEIAKYEEAMLRRSEP